MANFLTVCRFIPTLGGTTDWTYSSAVTGYQSPTAAGAVNGALYRYRAESADLSQWEIGYGTYNSGTGVFARTVVTFNSSGTGTGVGQSGAGSKINFTLVPQVAIIALGDDIVNLVPPQGRITLTSATPVLGASVAGATTVYYSPYCGNLVPIYDGSNFVMTQCAELSLVTTDATKSPAAVAATKIYDVFVWNDAGTIRFSRSPAWTNATTRGFTLTMVNGILLNTSTITNGPAALRGTYVGTIASNASSTIDFIFGATGSNGVAGVFNVWNAYNRVNVGCTVVDNAANYTYTSATIRQAHGSASMQVSFVVGLAEDAVQASHQSWLLVLLGSGSKGLIGLGFDSTTAFSSKATAFNFSTTLTMSAALTVTGTWNAPVGTHVLSANEQGDGTNANTFNADGVNAVSGLNFSFPM